MELSKETAIIESIIFLENEPVSLKQLVRVSELAENIIVEALAIIKEKYTESYHGIELVEISGGFTFSPKEELWSILKDHYGKKNDEKLSRAAMETLSIIAYSQPLTKTEVENIRGVSADNMIRLLIRKGLVKEVGKKDVPGKPLLYGTTSEFLKAFRLNSIADLPKLDEQDRDRFELNG
ncbi:SMC-Scp complex subunit ScpB [Spirochaeta isovalerica]|uniref:Segregation and condensation protein B n=1 Tax=Spirochaeta isovalerica TaxID=150 RepID=A0A841R6J1_9SPIO|nr:SMC-Scp complex subunit ScpB [Spirochaeta isovalerica]MBB6478797.1 segregation and condensation protein B [Spirochaeta isovalerica]